MDTLEREIEAVKPVVSGMIMSSQCLESTKKKILMIYLLVSLGLMYLFEDEIEECLKEGFGKIEDMLAGENDLYTVSTIFWVFRTYGYNISSGKETPACFVNFDRCWYNSVFSLI